MTTPSDHAARQQTRQRSGEMTVNGVALTADVSGTLVWGSERLLVVSDLHLEKGSSFAVRGTLLPPFDTPATLARLAAAIAYYNPRIVIALGDSFHDRHGHERLPQDSRDAIRAMQNGRDWIWIAGNHDPDALQGLDGTGADEVVIGPLAFRHEPTGAAGEIAGHLHPTARVSGRGRAVNRRCFASDGMRAVMPAFGAYSGGISVREAAFAAVFGGYDFVAHVMGDRHVHAIAASRCR